jgi:hypothetical protein
MPKSAAKPTPLRAVETCRDLAWIDDVPPASRTEVRELALHILESGGTLTPADALQLTEYGRLSQEMRDAEALCRASLEEGDTKTWLALKRKVDSARALQRGLLRDLRMTRNTAVSTDTKAAAKKLAERSGASWEGVL